jgi:mitochondrial chaperone BCS1
MGFRIDEVSIVCTFQHTPTARKVNKKVLIKNNFQKRLIQEMLGSTHHDDDSGGGGGYTSQTDGFQIMGLVNAFKTGDVQTDMLIALIIPLLLKFIFDRLGRLEEIIEEQWKYWMNFYFGRSPSNLHERFISYSTMRNSWGYTSNLDEDTKNSVLLKAIKLYLHQVVKLNLQTAHVDLTEMKDRQAYGYYNDSDSDDEDDNDDNDHDEEDESDDAVTSMTARSRKTMAGMLSRYKIIKRLPNNEWHDLGKYGRPKQQPGRVQLRIEHQLIQDGDGQKNERNTKSNDVKSITFHFTSPTEGAIDGFIDTAYRWYVRELGKMEDHSRYMYEMKVPEIKIGSRTDNEEDGSSSNGIRYRRYKLSARKTFDSLFFREKHDLLSLVDHFNRQSGKYAIPGYPHKLGLLLHGPPGTGKTSLIKALAQYTGRSIVNVPLSRVATNSELASIFFDRKYNIEGSYVPVNLSFKDVIFVCEDVDAASKIVKRRDGKTAGDLAKEDSMTNIDLPDPKSIFRMFLESSEEDCKNVVATLVDKSERLKAEAEKQRPLVLKSIAQRLTRVPALGMIDEADNADLARVCKDAMDLASTQKDQYSKLDEILSAHAQSITSLIDSGCEVDEDFVDELLGEKQRLVQPSVPKPLPHQNAGQSSSFLEDGAGITGNSLLEGFSASAGSSEPDNCMNNKTKTSMIGPSLFKQLNPDALSLAGLLNVLDGVVDTPGRILIMTTNHPEALDPALVRPGRIDKRILLGFMRPDDVVCMLELYFQTELTEDQKTRVHKVICTDQEGNVGVNATPAQIEQLAAEHDRLDDMMDALEKLHPAYRNRQHAAM